MAAESVPVKVLTVGPALGSISDLFSKIKNINAKHGPFDFALCVGDFFAEGSNDDEILLLQGKLDGSAIGVLPHAREYPTTQCRH
jgi:hypothetical protein